MLALGAGGILGGRCRVNRPAIVALVVTDLRSRRVSWITIRVLVLLGSVADISNEAGKSEAFRGERTYGSRGQSVQRACSHPSQILECDAKSRWHWQHVLRTLCRGLR